MLFGAGGNMGLLVTDQGLLLVDSEYPQLSDKIKAKLAALSAKPLRYLVDTHFHWDHVGGNAGLSATGATIIATPQTLHYVDESFRSATKRPGQFTFDPTMLPTLTTKGPMTIHLGGETVEIIPIKPAHTDGDLMVRFVNADVIAAGDAVVKESYPLVDVAHGGSIDQLIAFCDDLYALATPKTRIIPGHGPLVDREYVKAYRAMLVTARDRVAKAIRAGKTLDQVVAAKPLADLDAQWEGTDERFKEADFLKQVYGDLSRSKKP
jgi:glyoxylase-like metal-dependent hydrolase (beta-lactamase superfamily II)